jgi:hypothetical protein
VKLPVPVYGAVPPDAETLILAEPPLQAIGVVTEAAVTRAVGCETTIVVVVLHRLSSVTV